MDPDLLTNQEFEERFGYPRNPPDPNSAAVDAIENVIKDCSHVGDGTARMIARNIREHLREHPEHGPWPVMTEGDMQTLLNGGRISQPILVIPDPDPPAAEVPSVEDRVDRLANAMATEFPDAYGNAYRHWAACAIRAIDQDPSLVEAANGGGAK